MIKFFRNVLFNFFFLSDPSNPSEQFVSFFIVGKAMPADMTVSVSANYMSASGQTQLILFALTVMFNLISYSRHMYTFCTCMLKISGV